MKTVVVTGLGVVCPGAADPGELWESLCSCNTQSSTPRAIPDSKTKVAEVSEFSFLPGLTIKRASMDRSAQFALAAAGQALDMAGLVERDMDPVRIAVVIGNGGAGLTTMDDQFKRLYETKKLNVHPLSVSKSMSSSSASWVSIIYGAKGPTFVVASACASGTHAIGIAAGLIRSGMADVAIAGGTEAPLGEGTIRAWEAMKIMSSDVSRPFSKGRLGLILSEGAGILVLEAEDHARKRDVPVLGRVAGFSCSADAGDMFNPSVEGMSYVMRESIKFAGLRPEDVDYINAHGTGTLANDLAETSAIRTVFETASDIPPVSSTKSVVGHGLGASGAIEAVACILAMKHQIIPPTANFLQHDPGCDIDCVPNTPRTAQLGTVLSNSFAFGGLNASLVFTQ